MVFWPLNVSISVTNDVRANLKIASESLFNCLSNRLSPMSLTAIITEIIRASDFSLKTSCYYRDYYYYYYSYYFYSAVFLFWFYRSNQTSDRSETLDFDRSWSELMYITCSTLWGHSVKGDNSFCKFGQVPDLENYPSDLDETRLIRKLVQFPETLQIQLLGLRSIPN